MLHQAYACTLHHILYIYIPPCICILVIYTMLMHIGSPEGVILLECELVEEETQQEQEI